MSDTNWKEVDAYISANWQTMSDGQIAKVLNIRKCHVKKRRLVDLNLFKYWKSPDSPKRAEYGLPFTQRATFNYKERLDKVLEIIKSNHYKGNNEFFQEWLKTEEGELIFCEEMEKNNLLIFRCQYKPKKLKGE